jgi:hypothetical protein
LLAWIISPWNSKAKLWTQGRKRWLEGLQQAFNPGDRVIWSELSALDAVISVRFVSWVMAFLAVWLVSRFTQTHS